MIKFLIMLKFFTYILMSLLDWRRILFSGPNHPPIPNVRETRNDSLYLDSFNRSILALGASGTGKTEKAAEIILRYIKKHPDRSVFVLDAAGSITKVLIRLIYLEPEPSRSELINRLLLDMPGRLDYIVPFPFFSLDYGSTYEEQAQRVKNIYEALNEEIMGNTPIMAISIREDLPEICRLLTAMENDWGEPAQITEAKNLIIDAPTLRKAADKYGHKVKGTQRYFKREFLEASPTQRDLRTYSLRAALQNVSAPGIRERFGLTKPSWTPKSSDEKGQIVIVSGERLINQKQSQAIVFNDVFAKIMEHVNNRVPHDPSNKPILLVIDEVRALLKIRGIGEQLVDISNLYRSRGVQLFIILQALYQASFELRDQLWSFANIICFKLDDFEEAKILAMQLFKYDPQHTKFDRPHERGQPIVEQPEGQYVSEANWLQHLKQRECVMRKYKNEFTEEEFVSYIRKTSENPKGISDIELQEIKEQLVKKIAVPIEETWRIVNQANVIKRPYFD